MGFALPPQTCFNHIMTTHALDTIQASPFSPLDITIYARARLRRDADFDGVFFVCVKSTGIYCRPVCPARLPLEKNVEYRANAVACETSGYRACLRCRPESAPKSPAWNGTKSTVSRAVRMIEAGALDHTSIEDFAERLGVGARHLRRLFHTHVGTSPVRFARGLKLDRAQTLLQTTDMPIVQIADSVGFGSLKTFNTHFKAHFGMTPRALRGATNKPT